MAVDSSPPSSYSFHGSNSSHSKDNRSGGRTYHIPNYATNYTNERSNLITVSFDEGKGYTKITLAAVVLLLFVTAVPLVIWTCRFWELPQPSSLRPSALDMAGIVQTTATSTPAVSDEPPTRPTAQPMQSMSSIGSSIRPTENAGKFEWEKIIPDEQCHGYGTRGYTAHLYNLSVFSNWSKTCRKTVITIHEQHFVEPNSCESSWPFGSVKGRWIVSVNDSACHPRWGTFQNMGCMKDFSRRRRVSAPLKYVMKSEDAMALCVSTPAVIGGRTLERPDSCEKKGSWLWASIEGIWEVEDHTCH